MSIAEDRYKELEIAQIELDKITLDITEHHEYSKGQRKHYGLWYFGSLVISLANAFFVSNIIWGYVLVVLSWIFLGVSIRLYYLVHKKYKEINRRLTEWGKKYGFQ